MDEEYTYNPEDYGSYGMSYDPNSSYSQAGFAPSQQYDSSPVDWSNIPSLENTQQQDFSSMFGNQGYGYSPDPNMQQPSYMPEQFGMSVDPARQTVEQMLQNNQGMDWANLGKSGMDALSQLFKGGSGGSTSSFLKGLAGLYAAGQEKKSNQYMAGQGQQNINAMRQYSTPYDVASTGAGMMTPGATSMRDAAMQQAALSNQRLQNFRADPNSDAGYKATTSQIENVLARQAAQHGNRNNFNATAPALLAAKAAAQMQYDKNYQNDLNSWDQRSGANINPGIAGGLEALMNSSAYGAQNNAPYMDAIGKILNTNSYESNPQIAELIAAINASKR